MRYEIKGDTLPVVICYLENGERMITERGSMSWMSPNMKMETTSNGGGSTTCPTSRCSSTGSTSNWVTPARRKIST